MRTRPERRLIAIVRVIATVATLLWLLLASANSIEESIAPAAGTSLAHGLADLLLYIQEETSVPYELSENNTAVNLSPEMSLRSR